MSREIYNIVRAKITTDDLQAFETQAKKMKAAAKEESGTLIYDFFINRDTKDVLIIEKYQDDEAFMAHMTHVCHRGVHSKVVNHARDCLHRNARPRHERNRRLFHRRWMEI